MAWFILLDEETGILRSACVVVSGEFFFFSAAFYFPGAKVYKGIVFKCYLEFMLAN